MKSFIRRLKFLFSIHKSIPFLYDFFKSKEVKPKVKILFTILMIGYVVLPFDLIPDFMALFGVVDDITVVLFILQLMVKKAPDSLKGKYEKLT